MSMENLTAAAQAMNALTARMTDFMDGVDDDLAAHQAAYAALSGNLDALIKTRMEFSATVDPDEAAPTNVDGGTFTTIEAAVNAAPAGSFVSVYLKANKTHIIQTNIKMKGRTIYLLKTGSGANPIIDVLGYVAGGYNSIYGFDSFGGGHVRFENCEVHVPTAAPDPGSPWSSMRSVIRYFDAQPTWCGFRFSSLIGGIDGSPLGLMMASAGAAAHLGVYNCTFDGPLAAIYSGGGAVQVASASGVTLLNGAVLRNYGTSAGQIIGS